ncbi:F-box/kelch-repeat protein At3g23880-like [Papaver somniferum]|uniref:F-box/kelch-repeat protein At3g23880-like n=1 Tax=Papaver somniferum TaxID=3469 RepID=UPI000E6FD78F|nr:F-box/kelch-repeat protein At3g23880-like [Papaver somniferum]
MNKRRDDKKRKLNKNENENMNRKHKRKPFPPLTEDITTENLSKLPLRSLLQYRCVCKRWSIQSNSNPKLIHSKKNSFSLLLIDGERRLHSLDNDSLSSSLSGGIDGRLKKTRCLLGVLKNTNIVGSCNGLFYMYREENEFWLWHPCLWNPYTQELKYLRKPEFPVREDWCILHRGHGFGYDAKSDDYKCVRIFIYSRYSGNRQQSEVHIYSFRSDKWKRIYIPYLLITRDVEYVEAPNGVFCNGPLHWFARTTYRSVTSF